MGRVRISNSSLNSYGTRILTSGMDISQYNRNPVMLYMHERGNVIGYMKDVRIEGDDVTGEPVFDEATEISQQCKKQFEFGSLRMVSAAIDIIEMSEAKQYLVEGQTHATITKSKLYEVSLVDIGANDDALLMRKDGKQIKLGKDGECDLPPINKQPEKEKEMELKTLALELGLPETATEEEVNAKLAEMKQASAETAELKKKKDALELKSITQSVERAIEKRLIGEDKKQQFIELGKLVGVDKLEETFGSMSPQVKLSSVISHQGSNTQTDNGWKKLSEVPEGKILELREKNPDTYKSLYKAEYGVDCDL